jgi:hypothetical protein
MSDDHDLTAEPAPTSTAAVRCAMCFKEWPTTATYCGACGFPLEVPEAERLRANARRHWQLVEHGQQLDGERRWLAQERERLLQTAWEREHQTPPSGTTASAADVPNSEGAPPRARVRRRRTPRRELTLPSVRNVLLSLGAFLLAVAALGFSDYAWRHLGVGARSWVLCGVTFVAIVVAPALRRRRPATAEAVGALALAMCVID